MLHLGCTNSPYTRESLRNGDLLHHRLQMVASELWGLDADRDAIELLVSQGAKNIVFGDLENLGQVDLDRPFDVIIAGEIIEHLNNPGEFLNGVKRFMHQDTVLLITTINAYCAFRFVYYGLRGKRGIAEPVHPDHVAYYSYSTLSLLLQRHGFRIDEVLYYDLAPEHRVHNRWFLNILNDVAVRMAPQWSDGLIAVCRR